MEYFEIKKAFWVLRAILYSGLLHHVGKRSYLGRPISILGKKKIDLGDNVHIYPGARIEVYGTGHLYIKNGVSISQNVHIIVSQGTLTIGENTLIGPNVYISNSDHGFSTFSKKIVDQDLTFKDTQIGPQCFIGFGTAILPGTILAGNDIVGANSVLNRKYEIDSLIVGQPGKVKKIYNEETKKWEKTI